MPAAESIRDGVVELRLDRLDPPVRPDEVEALINRSTVPLIATCRSGAEGGGWAGSEATREAILVAAARGGAAYVDVEFRSECRDRILAVAERVVLSRHWSRPPPDDEIASVVAACVRLAPAVVKLVVGCERPADALGVIEGGARLRAAGIGSCCFGMGEAGSASRLLAAARGDAWTYAAGECTAPSAVGQWTRRELRERLGVERWQPTDERYAVSGDPVRHSLSPVVFNAAFAAAGRPALYMLLPGSPFTDVLKVAEAGGIAGLSVTMPYKVAALEVSSSCTDAARDAGAANTLRRTAGGWEAHNTDGLGLLRALGRDVRGSRVAILGAGGAARGAAGALQDAGADVSLFTRRPAIHVGLAELLRCPIREFDAFSQAGAEVVINATPVGMTTDETPIATTGLSGAEVVLDMIYRSGSTRFLREAGTRGCRTIDGLEMFVAQAEEQFRWWTGATSPDGVMRTAATEALATETRGSR